MPQSPNEAGPAAALPSIAMLMGVAVLLLGLLWPMFDDPTNGITQEDATEFYAASAAVHEEAMKGGRYARDNRTGTPQEAVESLQSAQQRYTQAKEQVLVAQQGGKRLSFWLKLSGAVIAATGCVWHYVRNAA